MIQFPPRQVLVPLDGSESAEIAWEQARFFAEAFGSRIQGLHVRGSEADELAWDSKPLAWGFDTAPARRPGEGRIRIVTIFGEPAPAIADWACGQEFDLIVMGSHGYSGLSRLLMGSVSEGVARRSRVPVLIARQVKRRFASVLAPVHFAFHDRLGLEAAAQAARSLGATLRIITVLPHAARGDVELISRTDRYLADIIVRLPMDMRKACAPTAAIVLGETVAEIVREARVQDLVALLENPHPGWAESFVGTTAEQAARLSPAPVLVLPTTAPIADRAEKADWNARRWPGQTLAYPKPAS